MKLSAAFLILVMLVGSIAFADVYSICLDGADINGVKISRKVEIEASPFVFHYNQYKYVGTSDCSGEPQETSIQHRFDYVAHEMIGYYESLTLKFRNEERYLSTEIYGDDMLLIISTVYPFYKDLKGEWMNHILKLHKVVEILPQP
jgi:hypothetical protein